MHKNPLLTLFLIVGLVTFWSCSDEADAALKVTSTSCAFDAGGGEKIIVVATDQETWDTGKLEGDWYTATAAGDQLRISAPSNATNQIRRGTLAVIAGNVTIHIQVIQEAAAYETTTED